MLLLSACQKMANPDSTPMQPIVTELPSTAARASLLAVTQSVAPARDMVDLVARFRGIDAPRVARTSPAEYEVGQVESFWIKNLDANETERLDATLRYRSPELNMWFQEGLHPAEGEIIASASTIETAILRKTRAIFGQEWQPGVDGDRRLNILHLKRIGGQGTAYFWSGDEHVTAVNPYSNEREILYVGMDAVSLDSTSYYAAITHELEHLIQWYTDPDEDAWLNEGLAELAVHVNGYPTRREQSYAARPDIQLNTLSQDPERFATHYAAATLFSIYFFDRFGENAARRLAQHPANGIKAVSLVLDDVEAGTNFDDLFADWLVANYLDGIGQGSGIHQYKSLDLPPIRPEIVNRFPFEATSTVQQYGADYILLQSEHPVTIKFSGATSVNLIASQPHSGDNYWMSIPADASDMRLTREFDLSELDTATLSFWTWYEIEEGWDYGYVSVSSDSGRSWRLLETSATTRTDPSGNSLGPGFTGISGSGDQPAWIQQEVDLSQYAGQSILIRFEYVTDGAIHEQGFVIDDIAIPELGYFDDAEGGDAGWLAAGFARTGQAIPQQFIVQQIIRSDSGVDLHRLQLDERQSLQWQVPMDSHRNEAMLIISGSTPVTRIAAAYMLEANP